ncbi:hypothetical protein CRG98_002435 [Punica granatum]|uniref:Uncharacterized protein n=1 Tax=Punica granatum TaxID=22663 RepID=A0A2I0L928_PUNGR|nr:hypothetical protein CRG98_002435 [Punica granatum]
MGFHCYSPFPSSHLLPSSKNNNNRRPFSLLFAVCTYLSLGNHCTLNCLAKFIEPSSRKRHQGHEPQFPRLSSPCNPDQITIAAPSSSELLNNTPQSNTSSEMDNGKRGQRRREVKRSLSFGGKWGFWVTVGTRGLPANFHVCNVGITLPCHELTGSSDRFD